MLSNDTVLCNIFSYYSRQCQRLLLHRSSPRRGPAAKRPAQGAAGNAWTLAGRPWPTPDRTNRLLVKRAGQPCDNTNVNYFVLTGSSSPGLSLVTAAVARSLRLRGFRVAPLYLGPPAQQTFPCPEGGTVSRPAAILAEACGILPEARFEAVNPSAFGRDFDWLVVQAAEFNRPLDHCRRLAVSQDGPGYLISGDGFHLRLPAPPEVTLSPEILPEVEALPPYRPGVPRIGVVSLPHITNFDDFLKVPGAEWIAFPLPGRLDVIFYPETS